MGLIKNSLVEKITFATLLFLVWGGALHAQNTAPGQLGTEIQNLEQRLSLAGISSIERYDALVRLARLRQLSGNIAGAAANWLEAAAANPNDDNALIAGAYCLTAIGEWERAALTLQPLLVSGRRGSAVLQARYLDACLRAWFPSASGGGGGASFGGNTVGGDVSILVSLSNNPEFISLRPLIYYTLWQTVSRNSDIRGAGSAEYWRSRLLAEFPKSPEARVINSSISAVQSPLWLLLPGMAANPIELAKPIEPTRPAATPQTSPPMVVPPPKEAPAAVPSTSTGSVSSGVALQTGVFGREANARAQVEALQKAGFSATVSRKLVNGAEHWAVTVPAGQDSKKTMQELKNAGFDSFPITL